MASFRGIGDAATEVKMKQDAMAIQASAAAAARAQQDSQFKQSMEVQKENTAWTRSNTEGAQARADDQRERQLSIEEYRKGLDQRRTDAELAQRDVQTQGANLQLQQYIAAADQRKKADAAREKMAKTALAGLLIATELNGGVAPPEALEIFNREVGDKDNRAVGMGKDPVTGLAFLNLESVDPKNPQNKIKTSRNMDPGLQYAAFYEGVSKDYADDWHNRHEVGSSARATSELKRLEFQQKEEAKKAEEQRKLDAERNDPSKQADTLLARAKVFNEMAGDLTNRNITPEQRTQYAKTAAEMMSQVEQLSKGKVPDAPKDFVLAPEYQKQFKISPDHTIVPKPDGSAKVMWRNKDNQVVEQAFGADGKPIDDGNMTIAPSATAPVSKPSAVQPAKQPVASEPPKQQALKARLPSDDEARTYGIRIKRDDKGNPVSATTGNTITGIRELTVEQALSLYEQKKALKEKSDSEKQKKASEEETRQKELDARSNAAYAANRASWKL